MKPCCFHTTARPPASPSREFVCAFVRVRFSARVHASVPICTAELRRDATRRDGLGADDTVAALTEANNIIHFSVIKTFGAITSTLTYLGCSVMSSTWTHSVRSFDVATTRKWISDPRRKFRRKTFLTRSQSVECRSP